LAADHRAVQCYPLSRADQNDGAERDLLNSHFLDVVFVRIPEASCCRCEIKQSPDGVTGPLDTPMFQQQGEGEQESNGGRLEPLADDEGSDDCRHHQEIHVGPQTAEGQ